MILGSLLKISFDALRANKLRSGLTLLGVIIGVTSVMTIVSALEGMQSGIASQLNRMGSATFVVTRIGMATSEQEFLDKLKRKPITMKSHDLIEKECAQCDKITPRSFANARIKYADQALRNVLIEGATSAYVEIVDFEAAQGRYISQEEDLQRRRVVFIGDKIRSELLEGLDPLGKELNIGGNKYTVIGVCKKEGSMLGADQDNFVIVPMSVFLTDFGDRHGNLDMVIKAASVERLKDCMDEVKMILRSQRHVPYDKEDDFDILTADNILDMLN